MNLEYSCSFASQVVIEAGKLLIGMTGLSSTHYKEDGSLITTADIKSEEFIQNQLLTTYKETCFVSEENPILPDKRYWWICDPLDGTTNYINELPTWGISLALMEDCEPVMGIIHLPVINQTVSAIKGKGTIINGGLVKTRAVKEIEFSDVITYCSWRSNDFSTEIRGNIKGNVRAFGSSAFHFTQFALGHTVGGWEFGAKLWDVAAGILIVKEMGGVITLLNGNDPLTSICLEKSLFERYFKCIMATNQEVYKLLCDDL